MLRFLRPVKAHTAITLALFAAFTACEVWSIRCLEPAINAMQALQAGGERNEPPLDLWTWFVQAEGSAGALRRALLLLLLSRILLGFCAWAKSLAATWHNMSLVFHMRAAVYDRLQRVGFAFHDRYSSGQLINRAISDLQHVRQFVVVGVQSFLDLALSLAGYWGMMFFLSPQVACAALLILPLWFIALRRFALLAHPIYLRQRKAADESVRILTENIAGAHVVRAFGTAPLENRKYERACGTLMQEVFAGVRLHQYFGPLLNGIVQTARVGLFTFGAFLVQEGDLELGALVVLGVAMGMLLGKVQQINLLADVYQRAVVSCGRLFEILDHPDTTPEPPAAAPLPAGAGAVRFTDVTFAYRPGKPVLNRICLEVPAGTKLAIVGPTASGKTTLTLLLARFYDPQEGRIELDGQPLTAVSLASLRDAVGYVFQENYLFSDTIARNIAYADLLALREEIEAAARTSRAEEFIERLELKYEHPVGEFGVTLSGGQRQRLAIARALLHNPRLLVLDDALSAVDPETEAQIRGELERLMAGRTVFLITSRIATARAADRIVVLEEGCITQYGTHDALMRRPGYYAELAASQFAEAPVSPGFAGSHLGRLAQGDDGAREGGADA